MRATMRLRSWTCHRCCAYCLLRMRRGRRCMRMDRQIRHFCSDEGRRRRKRARPGAVAYTGSLGREGHAYKKYAVRKTGVQEQGTAHAERRLPMPTRLCGTPIFFPLSSTELAYVFVIVIAGYARGGTVIRGTLPRHRRIAMPSFEHTQQP